MLRVDLAVEIQLPPRRDRELFGQLLLVFGTLDNLEEASVSQHLAPVPNEPIVDTEIVRDQ
jgi:hypothetical protein